MSGSRTRLEEKIHGVCLLSFDNGGPGTYSQLLILKEYMGRLASDLQVVEDEVYPADYFDLMGGAGFGGMVAFMLGHLRMNVDQVMDALLVLMAHISFDDSEDSIDRESNSTTLRNLLEDTLSARGIAADTKMDDPNSSSKQLRFMQQPRPISPIPISSEHTHLADPLQIRRLSKPSVQQWQFNRISCQRKSDYHGSGSYLLEVHLVPTTPLDYFLRKPVKSLGRTVE